MAKFFKFKKSSKDPTAIPNNPETQQDVAPEITDQDIKARYFGKSLSYLTDQEKMLESKAASLQKRDDELQAAYLNLLEERKRVAEEQQTALSDYNTASLEYLEKDLPKSLSTLSADDIENQDEELLDLLVQQKALLRDMKEVENEKEAVCAELDKAISEMAEEIKSVRSENEIVSKTRKALGEAITHIGEEKDDAPASEQDMGKLKKLHINTRRRVANKVRGVNFLNLTTYLKNDCELEYSTLKLIIHYAIAFTVIALIGLLYTLKLPYVLILCLVYFVFGPSLIYFSHRKKYEKKKFAAAVQYTEQMIFSFTRRPKLLNALEETRVLMSGKIAEAIDYAITVIRHGKSKENLYEEALKEIENLYPCARVKNLHELLIGVEKDGGECSAALDIMLEDVREWDVRSNNFQQEQSVKGVSMIVSILMSLGVCFFMTNILPDDMGGDITGFGLYQILTTISLVVMFFIYRLSARKLTSSWVNDDLGEDEYRIKADYKKVRAYAENPNGKIKPILAITRMQTAMDKAFPRWVTRFALLASSRPIRVALIESIDKAPVVMREELQKLNQGFEEDPNSIQPYVGFFKDFELPQVRSMMMMVYSLNTADTKDIERHIMSIVKRNHLLQATAEKIEYDEKMAMFTLFTTIPMLLACVIMMIDVAMILLNMMNTVM